MYNHQHTHTHSHAFILWIFSMFTQVRYLSWCAVPPTMSQHRRQIHRVAQIKIKCPTGHSPSMLLHQLVSLCSGSTSCLSVYDCKIRQSLLPQCLNNSHCIIQRKFTHDTQYQINKFHPKHSYNIDIHQQLVSCHAKMAGNVLTFVSVSVCLHGMAGMSCFALPRFINSFLLLVMMKNLMCKKF